MFRSKMPNWPSLILGVSLPETSYHSKTEERFYCFGKVAGGVLTVRFTYRGDLIRIIGAGYWRKGKLVYEKENNLHG